ncbi:G-protein alpha subunit-domain-containing protein [Mycena latifolia]|nr:G-protein alpha subunit-domain-containing protein [Mycena latifolia]
MADGQLYSRLLLSKGAGYPLWQPEPYDDLPAEYKQTGVRIGDVGIITSDGAFDFAFNICVPSDDPINSVGVPDGFEMATLRHGDVRRTPRHYPPGSDVSSAKLKKRSVAVEASTTILPAGGGTGLAISTSSREAAVLLLPAGGASLDLRRKQLFRDYALTHADNWYRFLNIRLGRLIENGAIYLVTGCDKAAAWGVACFSHAASEGEVSLELKASIVASGRIAYAWEAADVAPVAARAGPDPAHPNNAPNQAVFLRGYKVMLRERFAALRGPVKVFPVETAKPRDLLSRRASRSIPYSDVKQPSSPSFPVSESESTGASDGDAFLEALPEPLPVYHPSDAINALLLDNTHAAVAVTHDIDWAAVLLQDEQTIPDGPELYRRLREKYAVCASDAGVYFDSPENLPDDEPSTSSDFQIAGGGGRTNQKEDEQQIGAGDGMPSERVIRFLLLGQSESGKSTLLRQFERLYAPERFERERMQWRGIVQLNIVKSMRTVLGAVDPAAPTSTPDSEAHSQAVGAKLDSIKNLRAALPDVEDILKRTSLTENTAIQPAEIRSDQISAETGLTLQTATQSVLNTLCGDMVRLWSDPHVQATLQAKEIELEDNPGFFLYDLPRVTAVDYVPSDDEVMKARLETTGPVEHVFKIRGSDTWSIVDVGGSRTQRHKWLSFFQNVNVILFFAPMSCFDQYLDEDGSVNRLEDSWTLWREICSNILLAQVDLILFLNKYDIFSRKLKAGIQLSKFIAEYKDRSNDVQTASAYLRNKFTGIHQKHSPAPRHLHSFFTSMTDAPSSVNVISNVREMVTQQNLASSGLL